MVHPLQALALGVPSVRALDSSRNSIADVEIDSKDVQIKFK